MNEKAIGISYTLKLNCYSHAGRAWILTPLLLIIDTHVAALSTKSKNDTDIDIEINYAWACTHYHSITTGSMYICYTYIISQLHACTKIFVMDAGMNRIKLIKNNRPIT